MLIGLALKHGDGFLTVIYFIPTKHLTIFHNVFLRLMLLFIRMFIFFSLSLFPMLQIPICSSGVRCLGFILAHSVVQCIPPSTEVLETLLKVKLNNYGTSAIAENFSLKELLSSYNSF